MANITVIPASKTLHSKMPVNARSRRKVAGYARVSTDSEEQLTSYEAQVDYYTKYIRSNPDWEFVDVYTDEGISATNTRHRDGFNRMIADALAGKIDLIVTKSVSRFARNTVDSLTAVRKLKEHGTEVYFEKEGIYTFDSKGELLITIMSSLAQEESRSISENVTWGQRKRFADGKVSLPYKSFLGYRKGPDGLPEIVPEEAEIVREIYKLFVQGKTVNWIATHLTSKGIPTPRGKEKWQTSTIESILTNEKYKGSAVLQKKFTVDFLSKKMKVNEGEVPQYIVDQSHPAIINPEEWQKVQDEMAVRKAKGKHHNSLSPFSAKIVCGDCGEFYGSKVWHSTDKYRRVIWQCNGKFKGEHRCGTPHLYEDNIKRLYLRAVADLTEDQEVLLETCRMIHDEYLNSDTIDAECATLNDEIEVVSELTRRLIAENSTTAIPQDEYNRKYDALVERFHTAQDRLDELQKLRITRSFQADVLECFMFEIKAIDTSLPLEYTDRFWLNLIDRVTVYEDKRLVFRFKNGTEVEETL